jgi:hypothetical protein
VEAFFFFPLPLFMMLTRFVQGIAPVLNCKGKALKEVSWYFNVRGSVIDGKFIPTSMPVHFLTIVLLLSSSACANRVPKEWELSE